MSGGSEQFQLIDAPGGQCVRVRFQGSYAGRKIEWQAEIMTLRYCCTQQDLLTLRPFIDVGGETAHGRRLRVGLDVVAIDRPTVAKAVIMVRNYRRLREGLIEFGEAVECPAWRGGEPHSAPHDDGV